MELREIGVMEQWSNGVMQKDRLNRSSSNTPLLLCSAIPMLHYSQPLVPSPFGTLLKRSGPKAREGDRCYVPISQEERYFSCSAVSVSISTFMDSSLSLAISRSMCPGTG